MSYDQHSIDAEFRESAQEADRCVQAIAAADSTDASQADRHDECLGHFSVYEFLHTRPFLRSRAALLEELRWLLDAELPVPANAIDRNRFDSSRYSLLKSLIARFDRPHGFALA